jgi:excinuclease UvrABC nuclease subunit
MKAYEKMLQPHAVYRFYDRAGKPLYIGCSFNPFKRLNGHGLNSHPWAKDIATVKIEWCEDWLEGRRAEATAINTEAPIYNKLVPHLARVGRKARGNEMTCPRCGGTKENRKSAYCRSCARTYAAEWRTKKAAEYAALLASQQLN